jgi:hypothetical protein
MDKRLLTASFYSNNKTYVQEEARKEGRVVKEIKDDQGHIHTVELEKAASK